MEHVQMRSRHLAFFLTLLLLTGVGAGCSAEEQSGTSVGDEQSERGERAERKAEQRAERRAERRAQRRAERRAERLALRQAERRAERRAAREAEALELATQEPASDCDSNYSGACLDPNSSDYDCEGGSGDGPDYTGIVTVVGTDVHDLDRDGDGIACDT
jgi:sRNA-binding protein